MKRQKKIILKHFKSIRLSSSATKMSTNDNEDNVDDSKNEKRKSSEIEQMEGKNLLARRKQRR